MFKKRRPTKGKPARNGRQSRVERNRRGGAIRAGSRATEGAKNLISRGQVSTDDIIGFILANGGQAEMSEIMEGFELGRSARKEIHNALQALSAQKMLRLINDDTYAIKEAKEYVEGVLSVNPRGFGFVTITPAPARNQPSDVFVAERNLGAALHGDRVLIRVSGVGHDGKQDGRVIKVLERGTTLIVGIYKAGSPQGMVIPEDERFAFNILVRREQSSGAKDGEAVVAKITEYRHLGGVSCKGEIVEVLGNPDSLRVQTEIVIRKFQLPHKFSEEVERQLAAVSKEVEVGPGRLDLRDTLHITIDGETARDFDDAVAIETTTKGYRLYVSIADVSHYVPEGSPLDGEAYARGTSVYFPTMVVPMLPERLSNDLCSLVPNQDRYAFTAILDFDEQGHLQEKRFSKSVICSRFRMTYTLVSQILIDKVQAVRKQFPLLLTPLREMEKLARLLLGIRMARGSIGFELPEAFVEVDEDDTVKDISRRERNFAHQIIEEFMLAANEAVAHAMDDKHLTRGLYRIHETPDPIKVAEFAQFAKTMGMAIPNEAVGTPAWFGHVLDLGKGSPQEYIVNNLLLRTMKQARYSSENVGHFGLAASHYCHFTSPIRRYPDLMVHRALAAFLGGSAKKSMKKVVGTPEKEQKEGPGAGEFLSSRERVAVDAEREMVDRLKVRYMEDKIGESFEAIISGVASFGLFVELIDSFISGAVALTDLTDDYYTLDERNHRLIGKRSNRIYQIGTLVRVTLASVEKARRRINFVVSAESGR
ncbi:MAG: ribonuclease R [Desulfobulbaceae bacterium]|nr:ribonuclease R [Desulfobulbaceae bacterium]